ncbi:hypothetical protein C7S16_2575 [Burkholderia thailandensis]|uniref:Uncharacterized protein n=1 Tax=Burkholderia thailandensis TaxID=57975 RepID=A0AAW9D1B3_BURTH|nr:hypothetical protein [Burkholderia thailandensis]MDW9253811.1 hypothetical protein [Burkholderia thailandensis]
MNVRAARASNRGRNAFSRWRRTSPGMPYRFRTFNANS